MHVADTIAAIASVAGGAARGIVRLSGPRAMQIAFSGFTANHRLAEHGFTEPTAVPGEFRLNELCSPLPATLYCWPGSRSYTRQSVVEIHTLGSPPLLQLLLEHVLHCGARLAQPGEFTLRAFLAGRIDLTQAEAVLGLIDARHDRQFETALVQLAGGLSGPLATLREQLLELLAHLEAGLDFTTEDIQFITARELDDRLCDAAATVAAIRSQMHSRGNTNEMPQVVLYGWPNVGKSSLLNALAGEQRALVSAQAGTTRDYLTVELSLDGVKCRLVDTAGIEFAVSEPTFPLASLAATAQEMRQQQQETAHVILLCLDSTRPLNSWERRELKRNSDVVRLVALTKADVPNIECEAPLEAMPTSAVTGHGLSQLRTRIAAALGELEAEANAVFSTAARCQESLHMAGECLRRAREVAIAGGFEELVASEVRAALTELGKVVGAVYTDDVLDRIFSRFCIGK